MDFALSEEQEAIFDMARAFGEEHIAPFAADWRMRASMSPRHKGMGERENGWKPRYSMPPPRLKMYTDFVEALRPRKESPFSALELLAPARRMRCPCVERMSPSLIQQASPAAQVATLSPC